MSATQAWLRRTALAGGALLVLAAAVAFGSGLQTSTEVKPPAMPEARSPDTQASPTPRPEPVVAAQLTNPLPRLAPLVSLAGDAAMPQLRSRALTLPVQGISAAELSDTYTQARAEGAPHEALDIMAARGTPVLAVEDGKVVKLFLSKPGGITIYQFDPGSTYAYYYAHLDRYADGLAEGASLRKGQVIGYVGSTGNASPDAPHLHFAIFKLGPERQWWRGTPLNPYLVWRDTTP
ncbi:MAG: M23 family metallopeptidase [Pseudomonadota bacterium]